MAGKSKKDATDAIESLRQYLCRDAGGLRLLDLIGRYLGELRQERTQQKNESERLRSEVASLSSSRDGLQSEVVKLRNELAGESSRRRQAESESARDRNALTSFQQLIDAETPAGSFAVEETKWWHVFKSLRKKMPSAPHRARSIDAPIAHKRILYVFHLQDFVPDLTNEQFQTLGQFAYVICAAGFDSVALTLGEPNEDGKWQLKKTSNQADWDRRGGAVLRWLGRNLKDEYGLTKRASLPISSAANSTAIR